ncbi:MAG: hypothetical protein K2Y09_05055 [Nitrosomonas sp.]|uniref:hypothetical protein n=1 Tax=Nitrosomonas sp. TaxID=42353 RepID=UPI001D9C20FE|nr:hypothetical protein [Nitrosomonas sp.]MBX9894536.1 hypothetical protein [Nitrosomonas sp.]
MHNDNLKSLETSTKVKGMYDGFESVDKRKERMVKLGLDPNNHVHIAAAAALLQSEYLKQAGKKTVAKDYGKKLDKITKQALKLSEDIKELELPGYRNHFENNFRIQINPGEMVYCGLHGAERILHALIKAIQSAKESAINPINDGYYTPFLFCFIHRLFSDISMSCQLRYQTERTIPTEDGIKEILTNKWENGYFECARETAIFIIQTKLKVTSDSRQTAQKAVDKVLNHIVEERINFWAKWLIENC